MFRSGKIVKLLHARVKYIDKKLYQGHIAGMSPEQYLQHFGTRQAMAKAALVTTQAVYLWFKEGKVPARSAAVLDRAIKEAEKAKELQ